MAESIIFILLGGISVTTLILLFGWSQWFDPRWIVLVFFVLIIPGLYAAFTTAPFVPSSRKRHVTMLKLADITSKDTVYEIGFGGGWLIFQAAKQAKKAIGYELSIPLVIFGKLKKLLIGSKANLYFGDMWKQNYDDADIIFCYIMPNAMKRFYKEIWPTLKPGTRLISNAFRIHDLQPTQEEDSVFVYTKK
ncbi:hypothetical protein COY07_00675 [Candidatus Peregrinibacteria bacterium CG_4_10_14_0_2_um_filter_43_11]|nr:MAG: hypothetical protein COY07_00675 [Candidatus Peregrinibacteria bacterium CG_4_10_14_0_2_um_filter_43_11]